MMLVEQRATVGQRGEVVAGHLPEPLGLDRKARKRVALRCVAGEHPPLARLRIGIKG